MKKHQLRGKFQSQKVIDRAIKDAQFWTDKSGKYSANQIFKVLVHAALNKSSVEDVCPYLQNLAGGYGSSPSADVVLRVLNSKYACLSLEEIETLLSSNLQRQAMLLPHFRRRRRSKVILAIDLHDEEYYGKPLSDDQGRLFTMYGQRRNQSGYQDAGSKRRVFRYATASIVGWGKKLATPITIGLAVNYKGQLRLDVVKKLLQQIQSLRLRLSYLVVDGGFASVDCFKFLDSIGLNYISRGYYRRKGNYPINQNFPYILSSRKSRHQVNSFVILKKFADGKVRGLRYLSSEPLDFNKIQKVYGKRFRIENSYRHARVVKIRTSTQKLEIRWVLWAISLLLELLWQLVRYIFSILGLQSYLCRQKQVNREFKGYILENLDKAKFYFN